MSSTLGHVGIAVRDIDAAVDGYRRVCPDLIVSVRKRVPDQGVEVCFLDFPSHNNLGRIELLQPLDDDTPVGRFIKNRGEGQHHICITCGDIEERIASLREAGVRMIDETPRIGALGKRIAFIHPESTFGTLIELEEE